MQAMNFNTHVALVTQSDCRLGKAVPFFAQLCLASIHCNFYSLSLPQGTSSYLLLLNSEQDTIRSASWRSGCKVGTPPCLIRCYESERLLQHSGSVAWLNRRSLAEPMSIPQ